MKASRWIKVALFVSLAVNILVLGIVLGGIWSGYGPSGSDRAAMRPQGLVYLHALPRDDRRALRKALAADVRRTPSLRNSGAAQVTEVIGLLRQTPFDSAAFSAQLSQSATVRAARDARGRSLLVEKVTAMSEAERSAYADRIAEILARRK